MCHCSPWGRSKFLGNEKGRHDSETDKLSTAVSGERESHWVKEKLTTKEVQNMGEGSYVDGEAQKGRQRKGAKEKCIQRDKKILIQTTRLSVAMARRMGKEGLLLLLHRVDILGNLSPYTCFPCLPTNNVSFPSRSNVWKNLFRARDQSHFRAEQWKLGVSALCL